MRTVSGTAKKVNFVVRYDLITQQRAPALTSGCLTQKFANEIALNGSSSVHKQKPQDVYQYRTTRVVHEQCHLYYRTRLWVKLGQQIFVHKTEVSCVKRRKFLKLRNANKQIVRSDKVFLLHLQIGNLHKHV